MTRPQAIQTYLKHNAKAREMIRRLMLYNPTKSLEDNADKMKISSAVIVYVLTERFNLPRRSRSESFKHRHNIRYKEIYASRKALWNPKLTITGNAKVIGISTQTAKLLSDKFCLNYVHHSKTSPSIATRLQRIMELHKKGIKDSEIARFMGVTRERARQLVNRAKANGL